METQVVAQTETTQEAVKTEELTGMRKALAARKARKQALKRKKQESGFKTMIERYTSQQKRMSKRIKVEMKVLESTIGAEDFKMLKDICTNTIPEQKNEAGEVTQAAKRELNKHALMKEARNLIALQREERIKLGLRKRTTGRSSDRRRYKSEVAFLTQRNKEAAQEDVK